MSIKGRLKRIVDETDTPAGKAFDWAVIVLIVYSIVTLTIETLPELEEQALYFLRVSEIVVTLLFTFEYALRYYIADRKREYVTSFWGISKRGSG